LISCDNPVPSTSNVNNPSPFDFDSQFFSAMFPDTDIVTPPPISEIIFNEQYPPLPFNEDVSQDEQ
jgi:hypothetical protein